MGGIKLIFVPIFIISQLFININSQLTYFDSYCMYSDYTNTPIYQDNLNLLLTNLTSKSLTRSFYNVTAGVASDMVYGLFQCRYDVGPNICKSCVENATRKIQEVCPSKVEAIVWFVECTLRYSFRNIFSLYETSPWSYKLQYNGLTQDQNISSNSSDHVLADTMFDIIENASLAVPHFAFGHTNWTSTRRLYCFAECTPDIDRFGCNSCLRTALSRTRECCSNSTSTRIFMPSCQLGYDTSPILNHQSSHSKKASLSKKTIGIIVAIAVCVPFGLILVLAMVWIRLYRKRNKGGNSGVPLVNPRKSYDGPVNDGSYNLDEIEFMEYDFATLQSATREFSDENVLGEGGFGIVYKGTFENGQQLAIKRLTVSSRQSTNDFMTNISLLAELRHSNLARLVGFCSEGAEKLLVYEFMSNASLDRVFFDPRRRPLLNWVTRYNIITGIANGLQYLHEDSRVSIIHGDLKPSNILLDEEMSPKITDFGLAKLIDVGRTRGNTSRIVRTQGYKAPEHETVGDYSKKSDVYSFGIMILEIVSGQKNRLFNHSPHNEDLPIRAWRLWNEGRSFDLTDSALYNNCSSNDVIRCIQIGLLCVQANAEERPTIPIVVMMLARYVDLASPSAPATSSYQPDYMSDSVSDGQQSDPDQSTAKTVTWRTEVEQDLYPRPR